MVPRLITPSDLTQLMQLSREAGWNQTEEDWLRMLRLEPEGCFGIEVRGDLAATAATYCYGGELAWIGMVLTAVEYRRRGFARSLMRESMSFARRRGIRCVKLDATDMGKPLYADCGFQDEYMVERWKRPAGPVEAATADAFRFAPAFDREAFGADRARLIEDLARVEAASAGEAAYAMGRPGARAAFFGPCVAPDADAARQLLRWFLARHAGEDVYWDLIPDNDRATALARESGFEPVRRLTRMRLPGARFEECRDLIYALAGFEFG